MKHLLLIKFKIGLLYVNRPKIPRFDPFYDTPVDIPRFQGTLSEF
jgi:hypothetical protein